ncbi:transcriptional regulator, IclR family [Poseidonocella sedimentorum]|uniref:Transcriptional regulator, IclR family n=2 Tax=Poseidonocella sedimentorum TaxID=871652 RepID=A0A1I6DTI5_9RHOB|nr:IclR family transcriptional regulator [Poseidonocella sedimentorum]SFR08765.1 transcriptional regulator, IclR family [Poseidonocella sedimentorum]
MSTALNGSLIKALEILDLYGPGRPELTAKQVADSLGMSVATAHRFLLTLEHTGLLISTRRGLFELGQKLEDLGRLAFELSPLPRIARPEVQALSQTLNDSVMACRLGRRGPTCVVAANSRRAVRVSAEVGTVLPLATTAQGKLFLAYMSEADRAARLAQEGEAAAHQTDFAAIRAAGHATNFGENEPEIGAIAAPVLTPDNRAVLTVSVFGILSQIAGDRSDGIVTELRATAARIAAAYNREPRPATAEGRSWPPADKAPAISAGPTPQA